MVARAPAGVLSIGGVAIESAKTRDVLGRTADVVYLAAPADELWRRVNGSGRPLATDEGRFTRRLARREPLYADSADLTVDATGDREALLDEVERWWRGRE